MEFNGCLYCLEEIIPPAKGIAVPFRNGEAKPVLGYAILCEKCFDTYALDNFQFHWRKKNAE